MKGTMFKISYEEQAIRDESTSKYISSSGMYPIVIKAAWLKTSEKGSKAISFLVDYDGQEQIIFDAIRLTNNDGQDNHQATLLNKLGIIIGLESISEPEKAVLPIGKNGEEQEVDAIAELFDVEVIARFQMEYSKYNGKIMNRKNIKAFFRKNDYATAQEIVNNLPIKDISQQQTSYLGKQYEKELEQLEKNIEKGTADLYKDGLTREDIIAWIADRKSGKETSTDKPAPVYKGTSRFGKKV